MNGRVVSALMVKDLTLFFRNRFFAFITLVGLVFYIVIFFVMPGSVDETLEIALYAPVVPPLFKALPDGEGLAFATFGSEAALKDAVAGSQYPAGVVLPSDFLDRLVAGQNTRVDAFFAPAAPEELKDAVTALIREFAYLASGQTPNLEVATEVLGRDMAGVQIPLRDRMLPLIAVFIILTETLGLASLLSEEIEAGTIRALLITLMTVAGFFLAKGVTGVSMAFVQGGLFMAATGGLSRQPLLILVALLLGAVLVTGIGFLLATLGKDLMSVIAWGIPVLIVLSIPAFVVMFPGTVSDWIKIIPSYYLVGTIHQAANLGAGWSDLGGNLLVLLGFDIVFIGLGVVALRRKLS